MMMRWFVMGAATLALLVSAPACKRQPAQTMTTETAAGAAEMMSDDDKEFMTKAAQGSMLEVALGEQIANRATDPDVRAFGQKMVTDHGRAHQELKELAASRGLALPTQLKEEHQEEVTEMTKLSGPKLDQEYADDMVEDHEKDVKEFREAVNEVKDPELRAWAQKTLPILESHLEQAKRIKAKVAPQED